MELDGACRKACGAANDANRVTLVAAEAHVRADDAALWRAACLFCEPCSLAAEEQHRHRGTGEQA